MFKQACLFCKIVSIILLIGALNWGLVGAFNFNVVDYLFGVGSVVSRLIYVLVGLAGLALLVSYFKVCPKCVSNKPEVK